MKRHHGTRLACVLTALVGWSWAALPAGSGESQSAPGTKVLDFDANSFRVFMRWRTPSVVSKDGKVSILIEPKRKGLKDEDRKPLPVVSSPPLPPGWTLPDFDDSAWFRSRDAALREQGTIAGGIIAYDGTIYFPGNQAEWQMVCLRGAFRVEDPGKVRDLRLSLRYHGGAVVYVNGQELQRGHLRAAQDGGAAGALSPDALAEGYPDEAYVRPDGFLYRYRGDTKEHANRLKVRERELPARGAPDGVAIPPSMLRPGLNVIAVEVHAAPVNEIWLSAKPAPTQWQPEQTPCPWMHAAVLEARLTAGSEAGLVPNVAPSAGIAIAHSSPMETVTAWDYALPTDRLQPIRLIGARNGSFSGKVVLSSTGPIKGLKAAAGALTVVGGQGQIPASAAQVRWAEPAGPEVSLAGPERFDRLMEAFPADIPVAQVTPRDRRTKPPPPAAIVPVWVTVRVPADAPAGKYRGTLAIEAHGSAPVKFAVPIELTVHGWKVPDPRDFTVHHQLHQSADTVARHCKVPLWSEAHWKLIGRSLEALQQLGNKMCRLDLIIRNPGINNTESMVRWVRKDDPGTGAGPAAYDYDFTIAEKYMDVYEKTCGKPGLLAVMAWSWTDKSLSYADPRLKVTVVDKDGRKIEDLPQPPYGTPENEAFWRPVFVELRKRLERRGWFDVTAVGYTSFNQNYTPQMVDVVQSIWPDGKWADWCHTNPKEYKGTRGSMPVSHNGYVWGCGRLYDPDTDGIRQSNYGGYPCYWKRSAKRIEMSIPRYGTGLTDSLQDFRPLSVFRTVSEAALQGDLLGLSQMGGDFWPLPVVGRRDRFEPLCDGACQVSPGSNVHSMTSPGPDGVVWNERMEMFREGVQVAEAIIFLQRAMEGKKISADLAARIKAHLDERARSYIRSRIGLDIHHAWLQSSGWQERDDRLFALAAEAAGG